jgi:hypothetical protein
MIWQWNDGPKPGGGIFKLATYINISGRQAFLFYFFIFL